MTEDARFEDAEDRPLRLWAQDADDLKVISALVQDSVFPITEMAWRPKARQFALLVNRFRWEDSDDAQKNSREFQRVQAVLEFGDVRAVKSQGVDRNDKDTILSLLAIDWEPDEDGTGNLILTLAGDGSISLDVECVDVRLADVTRPYVAPSGRAPEHGD